MLFARVSVGFLFRAGSGGTSLPFEVWDFAVTHDMVDSA